MTGNCAAGFWCKKGNASPWPYANETLPDIGEPCPYGYYCPEGEEVILKIFNINFYINLKNGVLCTALQIRYMKKYMGGDLSLISLTELGLDVNCDFIQKGLLNEIN